MIRHRRRPYVNRRFETSHFQCRPITAMVASRMRHCQHQRQRHFPRPVSEQPPSTGIRAPILAVRAITKTTTSTILTRLRHRRTRRHINIRPPPKTPASPTTIHRFPPPRISKTIHIYTSKIPHPPTLAPTPTKTRTSAYTHPPQHVPPASSPRNGMLASEAVPSSTARSQDTSATAKTAT